MTATDRIIGRWRGDAAGPTVVCVAGVHGNEPAGVDALRRVFQTLERRQVPLCGEIVGLAGNMRALALGVRFIDCDLNRHWSIERIEEAHVRPATNARRAEDGELDELRAMMLDVIERRRGLVYFLDLHTTSSRSAPFAVINDSLANRRFAMHLPVPLVLGLEEHVQGAVADYAHRLGCVTMGFEAGQHDDPVSIERHQAAVWLAIAGAGCLRPADVPEFDRWRYCLADPTRGLPHILQIIDRYALDEPGAFKMVDGYENFQPVAAGEMVGSDHDAAVRTNARARLFMPLYQQQGDDGFFLVRPVKRVWLMLSSLLRRTGASRLVRLLPGVRRHPRYGNAVLVEPAVARWYVNEVFHLLGYRRRADLDGHYVFSRRERHLAPGDDPPR